MAEIATIYLFNGYEWFVPNDWNNLNNSIHAIGGGGGGAGGSGKNSIPGSDGGVGLHTKRTNVSLKKESVVRYQIGSGGSGGSGGLFSANPGSSGGTSWFESESTVCAPGGEAGFWVESGHYEKYDDNDNNVIKGDFGKNGIGGVGNNSNKKGSSGSNGHKGLILIKYDTTPSSLQASSGGFYIKNNGVWQTIKQGWVKDGNSWKLFFSGGEPPPPPPPPDPIVTIFPNPGNFTFTVPENYTKMKVEGIGGGGRAGGAYYATVYDVGVPEYISADGGGGGGAGYARSCVSVSSGTTYYIHVAGVADTTWANFQNTPPSSPDQGIIAYGGGDGQGGGNLYPGGAGGGGGGMGAVVYNGGSGGTGGAGVDWCRFGAGGGGAGGPCGPGGAGGGSSYGGYAGGSGQNTPYGQSGSTFSIASWQGYGPGAGAGPSNDCSQKNGAMAGGASAAAGWGNNGYCPPGPGPGSPGTGIVVITVS